MYLAEYDPTWPAKFETEKKLIETTISSWISQGIHHVGSTAIPGLMAKPIIDIMVGVRSLEESRPCIELLEKLGYCYFPYKTDIMHWFCKPSPEHRTHHLYLIEPSNPEWNARLAFRDYLRENEAVRQEYQELKIELAKEFENDREAYTKAKTSFVKETTAKALSLGYPKADTSD